MKWHHYRAIVRKEFYQIIRDPGSMLLLTIGPVFLLLVFVFMLTSDVKDVPTAIVDLSDNDASHALIEQLGATKEILITEQLDSAESANSLFDRGEIRVLIIIPENYGNAIAIVLGTLDQFRIVVDGTEPMSAERALERAYTVVEDDMRTIVSNAPGGSAISALLELPVTAQIERLYNPDLRSLIGYFPGIAAMVLSLPGIGLTLAVARERELGTLESLVATPIGKFALLFGKITPYLIFGVVDSLVIVAVGYFFFDMPFRGNLLAYSFVSFFFMVSNMGLGLLISVMVRSQQLAMIVSFLIFLIPGFFLSGIFFPMWAMPSEVQLDLLALPITHYVAVSQGMYLQGSTLADLWLNSIALVGISIAMLGFAMVIFRKKVA